jgi:arsenate reductase
MYTSVKEYCDILISKFNEIPPQRRKLLEQITGYIAAKQAAGKSARLIYICTHNSRRSHFGQIWSHVAGSYFGIKNLHTFSGGTEVTAFNTNAINALKRIGFEITNATTGHNPEYLVKYDDKEEPVLCFSKVYDDAGNPQDGFAAIMTCSDAEENCPFISAAELKISTTYDDPKAFDNTALQDAKYDERCRQIALETLYVFSGL